MAAITLSVQARDELDAIVDYYTRVGAAGFSEIVEESIVQRLRSLIQYPRMGRVVPEIMDESIRELLYRNFRIVYSVSADDAEVLILTIFHSSKEFGV